jgi:hypothetical protein
MMEMSADCKVIPLPMFSVRNTNSAAETTVWAVCVDATGYTDIYAKVVLGLTWNGADDLLTCKLQQATSSAAAGAKDLTTCGLAATYGYNTSYPVDAVGNSVVMEARVADMDTEGGFKFVRVYAATTSNTGTDEVYGVLVLYNAREKKAQKEADASSGAVVYVTANPAV